MVAVFIVLGNTSQIRLWNTTFDPPVWICMALMYWNWKKLLLASVSFDLDGAIADSPHGSTATSHSAV